MATPQFRIRTWLLILLPLLLLAASRWFDRKEGEGLLIQRKYAEAAAALEKALSGPDQGDRDRILFLLARARLLAGDPQASVTTCEQLLRDLPGSAYAHQARFLAARAQTQSGKQREAAQLYRDEVDRLVGFERKEEVATTYLGLADKAIASEPPDHNRAQLFFGLALELGLRPQRARGVRLKLAESQKHLQQFPQAIATLEPLVAELDVADGKLRAMLLLGQVHLQAGQAARARTVLRDLLALKADAPESADAAYEITLSHGVPNPAPRDLDRAIAALDQLRKQYPAHPKAKVAKYLEALCQRHVGRSSAALAALQEFLRGADDPSLGEIASARAMLGDVLAEQDQRPAAIAAWRDYLRQHPAHAEWERVQQAIVDCEFTMAHQAWQAGKEQFGAARERFAAFAASYPLDPRNPEIFYLLGDMLQQEGQHKEAREAWERCVSKYPGKDSSSHSQFAIGESFEKHTFHYAEALAAYKKVDFGPWAGMAQQRIALLTQKTLHLRTERTFRTDEKPVFQLKSRNIEKVRVRVFRLDLENYFRATHRSGNVEALDIEVIESDATFDSGVAEYQRYRETERTVELPFNQPGAYVVKVDDRELEATTMVLVTDLAMIVKSSRHELLVFTQNSKENRAEAGVKVAISDGEKILTEGVTGQDGVYRWRGKELQDRDALGVFGVNAAGSGASTLDLSGLGYSAGLTAKGYLFTDRPVYQPGQRANLKGIVREVKDGLYRLPEAGGYLLEVHTATGRLLLQQPVQFTAFGTFAAEAMLPADAELGAWRMTVRRQGRDDLVFSSSFQVARYERLRLELRIEVEKPVLYRGEKLIGKVLARHFYGEPAVGKQVSIALPLPNGETLQHAGATNAAGELAFEFATNEFAEEGLAMLNAAAAEDNVQTGLAVPVVTTELEPQLKTVRQVYLANEPFEVTATLKDRSGKPLLRDATAVLLRLEARRDRGGVQTEMVEVEVTRQALKTEADGTKKFRMQAPKGGSHRVRLETTDRFGNVVSSSLELWISGDDDEVKLRLLGDREHFRVGETAKLRVVNRAGEKLTLLCWQADGVLACEARRLPAGESELEIPIRAEHAPNFALALAMVDGRKLHQAEREFRVQRDLQIAIHAPATARPGAEVQVRVEAKDHSGKPVAAEVAVAMVDEAVLALYGGRFGELSPFFYGGLRETGFRTTSSCTWAYDGPSRRMSSELLAEERRAEALRLPAVVPGEDAETIRVNNPERNVAVLRAARGPTTGAPGNRPRGGAAGSPQTETAMQQQLTEGQPGLVDNLGRFYRSDEKESAFQALTLNGYGQGTGRFQGGELLAFDAGGWAALNLPMNEPRTDFRETGAWLSGLVTNEQGLASAQVRMPHSTTGWRLHGWAVTVDTDVGEADATLRTQQELQVELIGPVQLTEGDRTTVEARLHNLTGEAQAVRAELGVARGEEKHSETRTAELTARGEAALPFEVHAAGTQAIELGVKAEAGTHRDEIRLPVPVQPFGVELRSSRAGSTNREASFALQLPAGREYTATELWVEIGTDPGQDLVRAALGGGWRPRNAAQMERTNLARSSRGLAALAALRYLEARGGVHQADHARLLALAESMLGTLVGSQMDDGSMCWVGKRSQDLRSSAQTLRFFALCRARGMGAAGPALDKLGEWLLQAMRNADNEQRADLLWALATVERARFESLNSLHRSRGGLSARGLARLALAWQQHQRPELAAETLDGLRAKLQGSAIAAMDAELLGLAARALLQQDRLDPDGARLLEALRGRRCGAGWDRPEATAAAVAALALGDAQNDGKTATFTVSWNGTALTADDAKAPLQRFTAPAGANLSGANQVRIEVQGGGTVHYAAGVTGFASGFRDDDRAGDKVRITRTYLADERRHDNRPVPEGFGVLQGRNIPTFENLVKRLRQGERARVHTYFALRTEELRRNAGALVVEEPIPAGCSVPQASVTGSFDHVEVLPDRLVLYYREGMPADRFSYQLQARHVGTYRALPTSVYGVSNRDISAFGPVGELQVLPRDSTERDEYRWTPDALFFLGKSLFDAAEQSNDAARRRQLLLASGEHLDKLVADWHKKDYSLNDGTFREVARMLLSLSIERGDARAVVRWFEELKERYADLVIPFERIVAVAKAYFDLGEFESSLLVFRATAEASFLKDAGVATTLQGRGEVRAATAFLRRLLLSYPDLPTMRSSRYGIAQKLAAMAAGMDPAAAVDDRIGSAPQLRQQALEELREFLVLYPEDPLAEEVSFAWATTLMEGKDLAGTLAVAEAALQRYPESPFTDEQLYNVGYAQFVLGRHEAAFEALRRVADEQFVLPGGGKGPSENKWHAVYLQGQIHHARGEPALALADYEKVEDRFTDAGEAADYFLRKQLSLPEVVTFDTKAKPQLTLGYRNVKTAAVQVFRVDLMRLYLLKKSLNDIRGIQLHGIAPKQSFTVALGEGRDYRTLERKIDLDLPEPGAYLVVVRGDDLVQSGMVLRSDLHIEAQESCDVGRIRVNVKQGEAFAGNAHVKVIGSSDQQFKSGDTDLRGLFVADGLIGNATVIVKLGDQYAFHRGTQMHQPAQVRAVQLPVQQEAEPLDKLKQQLRKDAKKFEGLYNNFQLNDSNRSRQVEWLEREVFNKQQKGVEVYKTK